jgi:hypothetical protein
MAKRTQVTVLESPFLPSACRPASLMHSQPEEKFYLRRGRGLPQLFGAPQFDRAKEHCAVSRGGRVDSIGAKPPNETILSARLQLDAAHELIHPQVA